jgi:hypothetical protein
MSNKKTATAAAEAIAKIVISRSPAYASYYTNHLSAMTTAFDITFVLGRVMNTDSEGRSHVEQVAQVTFSPQHAKALAELLAKVLERYESAHGHVKAEPNEIAETA